MNTKAAASGSSTGTYHGDSAIFFAAVGAHLRRYRVDIASGAFALLDTTILPSPVQYAWQHRSREFWYIATSSRGPDGSGLDHDDGKIHHELSAYRVDPVTGALSVHGEPAPLPYRPIHLSLDRSSTHALVAFPNPVHLLVRKINADGSVGELVKHDGPVEVGVYPHQVRVTPDNDLAILVARGHQQHCDVIIPGEFDVFKYRDGKLSDRAVVSALGGNNFGPRHIDFHPTQPWLYTSLEAQHNLCMFRLEPGRVSSEPAYVISTLARPDRVHDRQMTSTLHVHPNGRFVYVSERVHSVDETQATFPGEDTVVAFAIDQKTGEPTFLQRVQLIGRHPRTFAIEASGRLMVVANKSPVLVADGRGSRIVPADLESFHIGEDGKLTAASKLDIDVGIASIFWSGFADV